MANRVHHFLVNARKAIGMIVPVRIGAIAETGPTDGRPARARARRGTTASATHHARAVNREEIGLTGGQPVEGRGRRGTTASAGRRATAGSREEIGLTAGQPVEGRGRHGTTASAGRRVTARSREATGPIAGRPPPGRGRRARSVSAVRIARVVLEAAVRRDSETGHGRRVMAIDRAASTVLRAIDPKDRHGIAIDSVRRAIETTGIAIARGRRVRRGRPEARPVHQVRGGRRIPLGPLGARGSGRRLGIVPVVQDVRLRALGPTGAHHVRLVRHGRRVMTIGRLASGATTTRPRQTAPWSSTSSSSARRRI